MNNDKIGMIGVGAIAASIVTGIMHVCRDARVVLSPRGAAMSAQLSDRYASVVVARSNQEVVDQCETVLICILPQYAHDVLSSLRFRRGQTIISAMAGVSLSTLHDLAGPATVCRSIPLPALARGVGPTPILPALPAARVLFGQLGGVVEVAEEGAFDAFSAVTGTISAHIANLATISDWLAEQGVDPTDADRYVAGMFSALDLRPTATNPLSELARHHATPGGINEIFAADLISANFSGTVRYGLDRIRDRLVAGKKD